MKRLIVAVTSVAASLLVVAGCDDTAQDKESRQQQSASVNLINNQPVPDIGYSQMRQNLIELETAEATGVQTTSFFFNANIQDPIRSCPSIGVPIPNTASLSNPHQALWGGNSSAVIDQMDPNGVYAPTSSTGTFVMCVDQNGQPHPAYWEGPVETEFGAARWNAGIHQIEPIGPATFHFSTKSSDR